MLRKLVPFVLLLLLLPLTACAGDLTITFFDVEQGDAALIECDGQRMLVDTGASNMVYKITRFLDAQEVDQIDYLVGTHSHDNHIGGFERILQAYEVSHVWMPDVYFPSQLQENTEKHITDKGIELEKVKQGHSVALGDATVTVIGPVKSEYDAIHNYSLVLRIDHGDNAFLLMGDAEMESERDIFEQNPDMKANVLKVGSHGSVAASSADFLEAVKPEYAIISCGKDDAQAETLAALNDIKAIVYQTDKDGNITLISDGSTVALDDGERGAADEGAAGESDADSATLVTGADNSDDDAIQASVDEQLFGKTNTKGVNVRVKADSQSEKFAVVGVTGTKFEIYDTVENKKGETWYRIKFEGTDGYILGKLVDLISEDEYNTRTID